MCRFLTAITDSFGNTVTYTLDDNGKRTQEETRNASDVLVRTMSRVHDQLGKLLALRDSDLSSTDFTYAPDGTVETVTDALGRISDLDHDALGRLRTSIANVGGAAGQTAQTSFEYDSRDNLVEVVDPKGLTTGYGYNGLGDLLLLGSPDTGFTTYGYDSAGNRASQLDARGVNSLYSYDALNRVTGIDLPTAGQDIAFSYDTAPTECAAGETSAVGRLKQFTDPSGWTRYCYDARGNTVRKVQLTTGGPTRTLRYGFTAANGLASVTYPSGLVVTYTRNANGQINGVVAKNSTTEAPVTLVTDATYLPFGPLRRLTFGNGRLLDKNYDLDYGIESVADSGSTGLAIGYSLDAAGNVVGLSERQSSGTTAARTVTYDGLDRLTALKNGATTVQSFTYDATGNRTKKVSGTSATYLYGATNHRLTKVGTVNRSYDAAGNSTAIGARNYQYDDRGRMSRSLNGTTTLRDYRYNALGQRVAKLHPTTATSSVFYVYDEAGKLMGEYQPNGTLIREYIWLDDTLVATRASYSGHKFQYVLTDHLNTPRAVVLPSTNAIMWRWDLTGTAFGEHAALNNPDGDAATYTFNLRYAGQYFDSETGLHYNYFRDYEPGTGRYVQSDPIGLAGGMSTYVYVGSRVLSSNDPYGLFDARGRRFLGGEHRGQTRYTIEFYGPVTGRARDFKAAALYALPRWARWADKGLSYLDGDAEGVSSIPITHMDKRRLCDNFDQEARRIYEENFGRWSPTRTLSANELHEFVRAVNKANPQLRYDASIMIKDLESGLPPFQ